MDTDKKDPSVPVEQVNAPGIEDMPQSAPASSEIADEEQPAQDPAPSTEAGNEKRPDAAATEQQPEAAEPGDTQTDADTSAERVDFSDEDAALAASAPEFDLGEASEEESADLKKESGDYTGKTKEELLSAFETLLSTQPVQIIRNDAEAIKVAFYKIYRSETEQLRRQFVESGGLIEQFVPPTDAAEQRLKELFAEYRRKRNEYMARLDEEKEANYRTKLQIIEELKELIDSNETLNHTFNSFRELQRRWKETGPVPQTHLKDLWETYNMYVENFYNFIKINKELRDLDLKKNYEAKLQLCEEADALVLETSVITAFHKLQKLHEQWREIGPVANEYKEPLWDRFREASSKINKRHQEYFDNIKEEQKRNLELKTQLCVRTEELSEASPTTRKEWNKASEQLIEIQKVWKTIGFAPKKDNTKIYERFRTACDRFFENKRNFYLQTKAEMENNLHLKNEICAAAEAVMDSEQWKKTTDELIALQKVERDRSRFAPPFRCRLETLPHGLRPFLRAQGGPFLGDRLPIRGKPVEKTGIARGTEKFLGRGTGQGLRGDQGTPTPLGRDRVRSHQTEGRDPKRVPLAGGRYLRAAPRQRAGTPHGAFPRQVVEPVRRRRPPHPPRTGPAVQQDEATGSRHRAARKQHRLFLEKQERGGNDPRRERQDRARQAGNGDHHRKD